MTSHISHFVHRVAFHPVIWDSRSLTTGRAGGSLVGESILSRCRFLFYYWRPDILHGAGHGTRTHTVSHQSLNLARLPVPPIPRIGRIVPRRIKCVFVYSEVNALLKRLRQLFSLTVSHRTASTGYGVYLVTGDTAQRRPPGKFQFSQIVVLAISTRVWY